MNYEMSISTQKSPLKVKKLSHSTIMEKNNVYINDVFDEHFSHKRKTQVRVSKHFLLLLTYAIIPSFKFVNLKFSHTASYQIDKLILSVNLTSKKHLLIFVRNSIYAPLTKRMI